MITAASPMFTVFFAKLFIKEPIFITDLVNVIFVIIGIVFIVQPSVFFGGNGTFAYHSNSLYALVSVICGSIFLNPNVCVILRLLKGIGLISIHMKFQN